MARKSSHMAIPFEQKIVAIHQPNYFPWLGYFHKIYASDVFVFHDNVEHSKRYPTRRTRIRKSSEDDSPIWLTVPLKQHSDFALIKDLEIDHSKEWPEKHFHKLKSTYYNAPNYRVFIEKLEEWYASAHQFKSLVEWNIYLIKSIMQFLQIERNTINSSDLQVQEKGSSANLAIVRALGGVAYISGMGGASYQTNLEFQAAGISLKYSQFADYFRENILGYPFGLSALDVFFHLGENKVMELLKECPTK